MIEGLSDGYLYKKGVYVKSLIHFPTKGELGNYPQGCKNSLNRQRLYTSSASRSYMYGRLIQGEILHPSGQIDI